MAGWTTCTALDSLLRHTARWYVILLCIVAFAACQGAFRWRAEHLVGPALDVRIWYTPDEAKAFFAANEPDGNRLYAATQLTLDVVFPFFYGALLGWIMIGAYPAEYARYLLLIPLAIVAFDLAENLMTAVMALTFSGEAVVQGCAAGGYTLAKWIMTSVYVPVVFAGLILKLTRWIAGRYLPAPEASDTAAR
jgi:hypothetical protein